MRPRLPVKKPVLATSPFRNQPQQVVPVYEVGDRVTHDSRGLGRVVRISADRIEVAFGSQTVSLTATNSKLHPL
jgi:hypothetical protein